MHPMLPTWRPRWAASPVNRVKHAVLDLVLHLRAWGRQCRKGSCRRLHQGRSFSEAVGSFVGAPGPDLENEAAC